MRRITFVLVMLSLAAAACICVGPTTAPTLEPIQQATNAPTGQPVVSQSTPIPRATIDPNAPEITPVDLERIMLSAVEILAGDIQGGQFQPQWGGSGTIISPDGEIVTNCHVACNIPALVILMTEDPDQPPEPRYFAELTHASEDLDLATIQITTDMQGNPVSNLNLPFVPVGDSDQLLLGDKLYIFGYPSFEGATETITFTTGTVAGFESATVNGVDQRFWIKTDATIFHGNSGGTAVDVHGRLVGVPTGTFDIRQGVEVGAINLLKPINLVDVIRAQGAPQVSGSSGSSGGSDPDPYEPNDDLQHATGPLQPSEQLEAFISSEQDADVYFLEPSTSAPIQVQLQGPSGSDYDIYLVNENADTLAKSETEGSDESFSYSPTSAGRYWIVVVAYSGATSSAPYHLAVTFDGGSTGSTGGGGGKSSGISISGQVVDGSTGLPLPGGQFGLLEPGVTCGSFFNAATWDTSLIVSAAQTDSQGYFTVSGVPRGATYAAYFLFPGSDPICENDWLEVPSDSGDSDIGQIEITP